MPQTCNCPREHYRTTDGRCDQPPLWHDDPDLLDRRYTRCACCMADCPGVHAEADPDGAPVPGSLRVAAEYVATLPAEAQQGLRERADRGELRIVPRAEMTVRLGRGRR